MTNFTKKTFSVGAPGTEEYRRRWEQTFRGGPEVCGAEGPYSLAAKAAGLPSGCQLPKGHSGMHAIQVTSTSTSLVDK